MSAIAQIGFTAWLKQKWPYDAGKRAVLSDYAVIGMQHKHFLADVALRGMVFTAFNAASKRDAAVLEGRRELALEILKACKVEPGQLYDEVFATKPRGEAKS